jgi:hypothetical protein
MAREGTPNQALKERVMKTYAGTPHLRRAALARYLARNISPKERDEVEWHLEHCPVCEKEITVRDIVEIAKQASTPFAGSGSYR